jgi:hypothetical protein
MEESTLKLRVLTMITAKGVRATVKKLHVKYVLEQFYTMAAIKL